MISTRFVTNRHTLLAPALQMARQIKLDGNSIRLANQFELIISGSNLHIALCRVLTLRQALCEII